MKLVFLSLAVLVVVAFLAFDPSYQAARADDVHYKAQLHAIELEQRDLALRERQALSPVVVASDGTLRVGALVVAVLVVLVLVDMYRQRRRPLVRPDSRGLLPVGRDDLLATPAISVELARLHHEVAALRAVYQVPVPAHVNYAPRFDTRASELSQEGEPVESAVALPSAPAWASLLASGFAPSATRVLLGYAADGPVYGPVSGLLSTAIAGRPGQGKSTLLRFIYAQVALLGGQSVVWDLHGSIADDVAGADVYDDVSEIERSARRLLQELESRKARPGGKPLLVLVDEWPALSLASKLSRQAVSKIVLEGRKYGVYALIAGQGLPADQFGGSLVRDALSSRYVFRTSAAQGRMAGLEKEQTALLSSLRPGLAVLAGPVEPQIVAIPQISVEDVSGLVKPAGKSVRLPKSPKVQQSAMF